MAKLLATRTAQTILTADFTFNFNDTMADINGVTKSFGSTYTDAIVANIINLPEGAVVVGGDIVVKTAGVGPTAYTASLGDSGSATRYANAVDLKTAARTALTITGYDTTENLRLTIASTVANASAGKAVVRVQYIIPGRASEVVSS